MRSAKSGAQRFKCDQCDKTLTAKPNLRSHTQIHSGLKQHQCHLCPKAFFKLYPLRQHLRYHSRKNEPHRCQTCGAIYEKKKWLIRHVKTVHDFENSPSSSCVFCGKKCSRGPSMKRHILSHIQERPYFCKLCPQDCRSGRELHQHEQLHEPGGGRKWECGACGKKYVMRRDLSRHVFLQHTDSQPSHECNICEKMFRTKEHLSSHKMSHTKPFTCPTCGKRFAHKRQLKIHTEGHAVQGRPLKCKICFARFKLELRLRHHMKLTHDPSYYNKVKCLFCDRTFPYPTMLNSHLLLHIGERPFLCTQCPASFASNGHLTAHMKMHKPERKHNCELCGRSFTAKETLRKHIRIHTGEKSERCEVCQKRFSTSSDLKTHKKMHEQEREKFSCGICDKTYIKKESFQAHFRTHTGELPHKCRYCVELFRCLTQRRAHERLAHGK